MLIHVVTGSVCSRNHPKPGKFPKQMRQQEKAEWGRGALLRKGSFLSFKSINTTQQINNGGQTTNELSSWPDLWTPVGMARQQFLKEGGCGTVSALARVGRRV